MARVRIRVLGSLDVEVDGVAAELGGARQRTVFAVLLMHANEPVATDRLVSESWGESTPASATKTAQVYVSRLRGALGNDVLTATPGGYLLAVPPGALDTDELAELRARAREADPREAARLLRQGLALWRGPPYADLRYEEALQPEIRRLEELRLATLEERIEADLAAGEASQLVAELEALVAEHPHRERLRGFLMLALYRSGRQAEALETYRQGRQLLDGELGLEPGPELRELERAILAHDPALESPQRAIRRTARRRSGALLAAGGVLLLAAALTAVVFVRDRGGEVPGGAGAEALDPQTGRLLASVPLGTAPSSIAVGAGAVWVLDAVDKTISVIDSDTRSLERVFSTSSTPTDLAVGTRGVWIGNAFRKTAFTSTSYPESVSRIDPDSRVVVATVPLPRAPAIRYAYSLGGLIQTQHIAVSRDAVWVINPDLTVSRIDPRTNQLVGRVRGVRATSIAAGDAGVWVVELRRRGIAKIDTRTNTITQRIEVAAEGLTSLAVGAHSVWAADPFGGSVWRVDLGPKPFLRTIPVDVGVTWVAVDDAVWATNGIAGLVYRIDPRTNKARVVNRTAAPAAVAVYRGAAWVSVAGVSSTNTALPTSVCSQVFSGGAASPRFLIVSDLPLQGSEVARTHQMVEAIKLVLERRGYRAGAYTIGYQSCDDSTAQKGGYDEVRCYLNAEAYAHNANVIGIVGSYNSGCSHQEIPIANQAPDGPLAMISPSNTVTTLTRLVPGVSDPAELEHLYPTGEQNYVRTPAASHLTAGPLAQFAKAKGVKRLFLSWDRNVSYWATFAADVRDAARHLGLEIAGAAPFDPEARNYEQLARRIASTRADGIMLAANVPPSTRALLSDLRARLGPDVTLIGSEGFFDDLSAAEPAAVGMYVAYPGADVEVLPPAGKRFLKDLEARTGKPSLFYTASAAQAAEILLDAIARSDGTRPSVTRQLFKTRIVNGILGNVSFDANGDPVEAPVTIYRYVGRAGGSTGFVVDRVVVARRSRSK
jgi:DNA-binding SARP family transcriptional activator/ABC-type branched-subunit amino acid transport system substrate-binding protein